MKYIILFVLLVGCRTEYICPSEKTEDAAKFYNECVKNGTTYECRTTMQQLYCVPKVEK